MLVVQWYNLIQYDTIIYTNHFLKWDEHPELAWDVHGYRMLLQGCKARCGQSMTTQQYANGTNNQEYHEPMNGSICIRGPCDMTPTSFRGYSKIQWFIMVFPWFSGAHPLSGCWAGCLPGDIQGCYGIFLSVEYRHWFVTGKWSCSNSRSLV